MGWVPTPFLRPAAGVTSLLGNSPYVIRVNYAWSLLAGQVYGFSLTGLRNPTVPGKTSNLTMQTLDATGMHGTLHTSSCFWHRCLQG